MRMYVRKNELIIAMESNLGQQIVAKLEKTEDNASYYCCTYAGEDIFEVGGQGKCFAVNIEARTCGCRK